MKKTVLMYNQCKSQALAYDLKDCIASMNYPLALEIAKRRLNFYLVCHKRDSQFLLAVRNINTKFFMQCSSSQSL